MIELTIDEKTISVEANTTILDAARSVGIYIPTLCAYKGLSPIGACRVCVVEVEGGEETCGLLPCPCSKWYGSEDRYPKTVGTQEDDAGAYPCHPSAGLPHMRQRGECELQDITHAFEVKENRYKLNNPLRTKVGANPFLYIDFQKCIQCVRCARYTEDIEGVRAFDYHGSGGYSSEMDRHLEKDPDAESIAGVIAVCPVGSLLDHPFKLHSRRPWDLKRLRPLAPIVLTDANWY